MSLQPLVPDLPGDAQLALLGEESEFHQSNVKYLFFEDFADFPLPIKLPVGSHESFQRCAHHKQVAEDPGLIVLCLLLQEHFGFLFLQNVPLVQLEEAVLEVVVLVLHLSLRHVSLDG